MKQWKNWQKIGLVVGIVGALGFVIWNSMDPKPAIVIDFGGKFLGPEPEPVPTPARGEKFALSEEAYVDSGQGEVVKITASEFDRMVAEKKSFIVIAHMVVCPAEFPVMVSAKALARSENMRFYSLVEEEFRQTFLAKTVKYLPTAIIMRNGEIAAWLDAEKDEDVPYYKSAEGLKEWIGRWVIK